ncbi:MAG TPA: hypothetical protein DHU75_09360 [Rikenellaceae bacterium]|nr:hypothetical protein [Rikenellaceae bacterium]
MTFNEILEYLLDSISVAEGAGAYKDIGLWNSYKERQITVETMSQVRFEDYKTIGTVSNLQEFMDCVFKNNLGGKTMVDTIGYPASFEDFAFHQEATAEKTWWIEFC